MIGNRRANAAGAARGHQARVSGKQIGRGRDVEGNALRELYGFVARAPSEVFGERVGASCLLRRSVKMDGVFVFRR